MQIKEIIVHHTDSSRDKTTFDQINEWHRARFDFISSLGFYVGYHYVITGDGKVWQARRENEIGAHTIPNDGKIGIALTGRFEIETPSEAQLNSLQKLLDKLKRDYVIDDSKVLGHREKTATLCPGKNLFDWLKKYRRLNFLQEVLRSLILLLKGRK